MRRGLRLVFRTLQKWNGMPWPTVTDNDRRWPTMTNNDQRWPMIACGVGVFEMGVRCFTALSSNCPFFWLTDAVVQLVCALGPTAPHDGLSLWIECKVCAFKFWRFKHEEAEQREIGPKNRKVAASKSNCGSTRCDRRAVCRPRASACRWMFWRQVGEDSMFERVDVKIWWVCARAAVAFRQRPQTSKNGTSIHNGGDDDGTPLQLFETKIVKIIFKFRHEIDAWTTTLLSKFSVQTMTNESWVFRVWWKCKKYQKN